MIFKKCRCISILIKVCFLIFMLGCEDDTVEYLLTDKDTAREIYNTKLKSVIDSKCINCHNFHLEGANRFDDFKKTQSSIDEIWKRINSNSNMMMPPDKSPQLTEQEKLAFQEFFEAVNIFEKPFIEEDNIKLTFTAYKYPLWNQRSGVSGTFTDFQYQLNEEFTEPVDMLKDAYVKITTNSVDIDGKDGMKTTNIRKHFFAFFSSSIYGRVVSYNEKEATISFTMNHFTRNIDFDVSIEDNILTLKGTIDDMNLFDWEDSYNKLESACGKFHKNKIWPDVDLELKIPMGG